MKKQRLRVLVACEESQVVCKAFRAKGHEAFSCDVQPCSGNHPEWHIQDDVLAHLNDGWDMMIAHPPCTYLTYAGNRWFDVDRYGERAIERHKLRAESLEFFYKMWTTPIPKICIENPKGYVMNYIKHTQIIHPYYFGDECSKATCLWLKGLPLLVHDKSDNLFANKTHVYKGAMDRNGSGSELLFGAHMRSMPKDERAKFRSKTFSGIAQAFADQWG